MQQVVVGRSQALVGMSIVCKNIAAIRALRFVSFRFIRRDSGTVMFLIIYLASTKSVVILYQSYID